MSADYTKILDKLIKLNKGMNLQLDEDTNIVNLNHYNQTITSLQLECNNLEKHSEYIYNHIINLQNVTMYIPSVYIKED